MELRFNSCSHMHYIQSLRVGEVVKVPNISHGRPALTFKKVGDVYASEEVKHVHPIIKLLPEELSVSESRSGREGQSALESDCSSSGFSCFDVKDEIDDQIDDASLDGVTIGQMREIIKCKKRKRQNHLNDTEKNGVILTIKKEKEDEDELMEPLILWKTKVKYGSKRGSVKKNTETPSNAGVAISVQFPYPKPSSQSPSNYNSSIVVKIEDEPYVYPSSESCTVGDPDVICMDAMAPDFTEDIKQGADCQSNRNPCIMYTSQEMASAILPNEARGEAIACNLDSQIYTFKEAEICLVNEVMHEKIEHDVFWDDKDAGFSVVDHVVNEEARTRSLVVPGDPIEATQNDLRMDTLKSCDEDSLTGDMKMHLEASDLFSEMITSTTLQPQEEVSRDSVIQYAENREILLLNSETITITASQGRSSSCKQEQDIQNSEVQFEGSYSTTLYSSHETSSIGVCSGRSSSGEHLPDIPVSQDGEVGCEDGSNDDLHSSHEISDACVLSDRSPSQELQSEKQDILTTESLIVHTNRERLLSRHQTSDTGIFTETPSLNEPSEQDRQHYELQFEDSSGENLQSSHKACAAGSPVHSSNSADNPVIFASSGFCSSPYNPAVDVLVGLSHVKVCENAEIHNASDDPCSTVIDATTSTELGNDDHDQRMRRSSRRLFCTRKVISPKSQERLCKLLGSAESCDDKNCPRRKLIFQKLMNVENSGVPSNKAKRAELPTSPKQFYKKQKNHTRRFPHRDIDKSRPFSVATPSINSMQSSAESVIAFSQRQMQDIDCLATKLMNELNVMKDIIEESICNWNNSAGAKTYTPDEMREAIGNASKAKETTRKWLLMMARDCNRFCKIMRLTDGSPFSEERVARERKKIVFADEAGGKLCQVKYIGDEEDE